MAAWLRNLLAHPLTRSLDLDDPRTTALRRQIIQDKPFLRHIYEDWYRFITAALPDGDGPVLELGAGAGFLSKLVPGLIASEVFVCPGIHVVLDGQRLPMADASLRAIVMTNVLHHLPQPRLFFAEAARCVQPGGKLLMIEPWVSAWSKVVYTKLHHEPFDPSASDWSIPPAGPLSGANDAMPWIIFERDADKFAREFPRWRVERKRPIMPLRYLVSGGVSMRSLMPGWTTPAWRLLESLLSPLGRQLAMFAQLELTRV